MSDHSAQHLADANAPMRGLGLNHASQNDDAAKHVCTAHHNRSVRPNRLEHAECACRPGLQKAFTQIAPASRLSPLRRIEPNDRRADFAPIDPVSQRAPLCRIGSNDRRADFAPIDPASRLSPLRRIEPNDRRADFAPIDPASQRASLRKIGRSVRRTGFTLIEVLATLMLLGIVLPVAMRGISTGLSAGSSAAHLSDAAMLGQTKLMDLVTTLDYQTSDLQGDFGDDWPGYQWQLSVDEFSETMDEVKVTVIWAERGQERSRSFSTLVTQSTTTN